MTRATSFVSYASAVTLCYFLTWFSILPIPFIAEETKDQIIPVVRTPQRNHKNPIRLMTLVLIAASVVGAGVVRVLFVGISWMGVMDFQGLS